MNKIVHDVESWLEENRKYFHPPVCVKTMFAEGQLIAFFVGGPNAREDYHLEEGDEFFYQIKGDMQLKVIENGKPKTIDIREGEVFLLPKRILHSPQRFKDTVGFVIERKRQDDEMDCLRYYTENYTETLYEKWFHLNSFSKQITSVTEEFMKSEQRRTGKPIPGTITDNPPYIEDKQRVLNDPFSLKSWIEKNRDEIETRGKKEVFEGDCKFKVIVYGKGSHSGCYKNADTVTWQLEGKSNISIDENGYVLENNCIILIKTGQRWRMQMEDSSFALSITTFPV
ncbi:3-hydroxyanthranilate 3,4-dioxygenase-like [Centruroides vittatus]|uniref:3-hydroxyanthranilate 3,4-dioxygenase-like n=1 Tax=Centruroides vittatus TaxID=120091 RepID=UPI00350F4513